MVPAAVAGHSLGEYSALTIAGAFDFDTGLNLVKIRSASMARAGLTQQGTMAAIVGLDDETVNSLCQQYKDEGSVVAANYNSPGQVVISGSPAAVKWAMESAKESGARMTVELKVFQAHLIPYLQMLMQNR